MKHRLNYSLLIVSLILLSFGLFFLATLSAIASLSIFGNTHYYIFHQLIAVAIGLVGGLVLFKLPLPWLKKMALPLLMLNIMLLIIVFLPVFGAKFWGARRWISVGPITLQPSEFLKITAIMYLSAWLSNRLSENQKKGWVSIAKRSYDNLIHVFLPFVCLLVVVTVFLFFQKDLSTLSIIVLALVAVYFAAGTPLWNTLLLFISGAGAFFLLIKFEPYRVQRFLVFLHPETDPLGIGFQLKQSLLAIGSGGWFGKGLGMSTAKFGFLPQSMSDSIFAIVGEELGIIGCTIVILLFIFFFWQCIKIAMRSADKFGKLTAIGICTWLILQAFMNIASAIGIFPLAGIPLPFFSYGGSHIIAELMAIGLLLNISKHA
jgi:cell division protein FtsW